MRPHETRPRPWIKICGVTRPEDARRAVELGADLVGLNFWNGSPRQVERGAAREIAAEVRDHATLVGVFVNEDPSRIDELRTDLGLDLVQLHGDEPEEHRRRFASNLVSVVRADEIRPSADAGRSGLAPRQSDSVSGFPIVSLFLVDAPRDRRYGGTGEPWNWGEARRWIAARPRPVLVAGGIRPGSAAGALAASGAAGVDVASGVESSPGVKDAEKMRRLIEEIRVVAP